MRSPLDIKLQDIHAIHVLFCDGVMPEKRGIKISGNLCEIPQITVNTLNYLCRFAVSKFRGLTKLVYWRKLICAFKTYHGSR